MARKVFNADYDFIGFTYNGYHSIDDLKIYRVSDGDRYNLDIALNSTDSTAEVPGEDGMYFLESWHTKKEFQIKFAFEDLTDENLAMLVNVFNGKEEHELIFDEWPYKAYDAVVSSPIQINYICFDKPNGERVYKGDGTISFTCHYPYAHTPNKTNKVSGYYNTTICFEVDKYIEPGVYTITTSGTASPDSIKISTKEKNNFWMSNFTGDTSIPLIVDQGMHINLIKTYWEGSIDQHFEGNVILSLKNGENIQPLIDDSYSGINPDSYADSATKSQWISTSGLTNSVEGMVVNFGDLPAPFVLTYFNPINKTTEIRVGAETITIYGTNEKTYTDLEWRSDTGLVLAKTNGGSKKPIYFTGSSRAAIPTGEIPYSEIYVKPQDETAIIISQAANCPIQLKYNYWYY